VPAGEEERGSRRWWWVALALVLLLGGAALAYALTRPDPVKVPNEVGKPAPQAVTELARLGFKTDVKPIKSEAPEQTVVSHDPAAGEKVDKGSTITLMVSSGPGTKLVPSVRGKSRTEALKLLNDAKFKINEEEESSSSVPAGFATRTDPKGGTEQMAGSLVQLYISSGPKKVDVPKVVGLDVADARAALSDAGLRTVVNRIESDKPKDEVTAQAPGEGTSVNEGSTVTLTVSNGTDKVEVPDVTGLDSEAARTQLEGAGFKVVVKQEPGPPEDEGNVVRQRPSHGKRAKGSTVTIWVGAKQDEETPPADGGTTGPGGTP